MTIFSLGLLRDLLYKRCLESQPHAALLSSPLTAPLAYALIACGNVLVLSSMWALGVTGTYLGDYFGILMPSRVTGFPFTVTDAPMYWGSSLSFLGTALLYESPAGVALSALVVACYSVALRFEDPFTAGIYERAAREARGGGKKSR